MQMHKDESDISVRGLVKTLIEERGIGGTITLHDLFLKFPQEHEKVLSASLTSFKNEGILELQNERRFSSIIRPNDGKMLRSVVNVYKVIELPDYRIRNRPEYSSRTKGEVINLGAHASEKKLYKRAFLCNPNERFDIKKVEQFCEDVYYCADSPVYESVTGEKGRAIYEWTIAHRLRDFNSEKDVLVIFGDATVLAMACVFFGKIKKPFTIARYAASRDEYVFRKIDPDNFDF